MLLWFCEFVLLGNYYDWLVNIEVLLAFRLMWGIIRLPNERVGRCVKQDNTAYNLKDKEGANW